MARQPRRRLAPVEVAAQEARSTVRDELHTALRDPAALHALHGGAFCDEHLASHGTWPTTAEKLAHLADQGFAA